MWALNILQQEKDTTGKSHEPPEEDKVSDFLKNIRDSQLDSTKTFICRSNEHKNDFTHAQQYMPDKCAQVEWEAKNNRATNRTVGGVQMGKGRKSNASSKCTGKKGTKQFNRCQKQLKEKWTGGQVRSGTYFGHMEPDKYNSKSPEEKAWINALHEGAKLSNKKQKVSSVGSSMELLVASGAKTGTLTIGGQSVSFTVAAATTSTPPATASRATLGTDKKETWLSDEYKEARSKSVSAQFGSKGQMQRAAASKAADNNRKPAAIKPVSMTWAVSSASTGMNSLDTPIPKKPEKKSTEAAAAPTSERECKASAEAEQAIHFHPNLQKWKNHGMKFWAINRQLKDLVTERDTCGGNNPSIEMEITCLKKYTKDVVNALSQKKNKNAILDFEAWVSAQNGSSHTAINGEGQQEVRFGLP